MGLDLIHDTYATGFLINPENRELIVAASLIRQGRELYLHAQWIAGSNSTMDSWFNIDELNAKPAESESNAPKEVMPRQLVFVSANGVATLIGCATGSYTMNISYMVASGRINVRHAIPSSLGGVDYTEVHVMTSTVPLLYSWLGRSALQARIDPDAKGAQSSSLHTLSPEPVTINDHHLTLQPFGRISAVAATERPAVADVQVTTEFPEAAQWSEHQDIHQALADLMTLSCWHPSRPAIDSVQHRGDRRGNLDEHATPTVRGVVTPEENLDPAPLPRRGVRHLIRFDEIGEEGLAKWLDLRRVHSRAIGPALSPIYIKDQPLESQLIQTAIGIEALGYLLFLEDGDSEEKASRRIFRVRVERIMADVDAVYDSGRNFPDWPQRAADTYNGTKHANRELPGYADMVNVGNRLSLLLRAWYALRLGSNPDALKMRVLDDALYPERILDA